MKRGYTKEFYLELIEKIESRVNDFCLGMDVMAGFPGEDEKAFEETLEVVKKTKPLRVHIFPFSRREGTLAAQYHDWVNPKVIRERVTLLSELASKVTAERKEDFIGRTLNVLIEEYHKPTQAFRGHTTHYLPVMVQSSKDLINQEVEVEIEELSGDYLMGKEKGVC